MAKAPATLDSVSAQPTKRFFVSMLTRDIALEDAVLDLLDNCIDGVVRSTHPSNSTKTPYKGFHAKITMNTKQFLIQDNCGGMSRDTLTKAFRMGRIDQVGTGAATVGMYGIGMKRAMFKLGTASEVASRTKDFGFRVVITPRWMDDPDDWTLPVTAVPASDKLSMGTRISVTTLRPDVAARFDEKQDNFIRDFRSMLAAHFALIMAKGFSVWINDVEVKPEKFTLLVDTGDDTRIGEPKLRPYVFIGEIDGVKIEIFAGLYRSLPTDQEIEADEEVRASRDEAGWTIVCNDRVVLHNDKTRMTGWGEAGVPSFHGQFMSFSGVVIMRATSPWNLPLTTTKRGIDASSNVYSMTKDFMREATKAFTSFTNKWKRSPEERTALYRASPALDLSAIRAQVATYKMTATKKVPKAVKYVPSLPVPKVDTGTVRISYARPRGEFEKVALHLFEELNVDPRQVGDATFDLALASANGA